MVIAFSGADLAEIEDALGGGGEGSCVGGVESSVLQRGGEVFVLPDFGFDRRRIRGLDLLLFLCVFGFDGDFLLLHFFIDRVAMMDVAGDSADGKHQDRNDEDGKVAVHPGSRIKISKR